MPALNDQSSGNGQPARWERWITISAVLAILVYGAAIRWSLPRVPFADPDAWGYIGPSVTAQLDGHFIQIYGRSFLYPIFVHAVLQLIGSFAGLASVQHVLGLGGAVIFWAAWNELGGLFFPDRIRALLHSGCGLVAFACYTLSNKLIFYEHSLRPEAVLPVTACFTLWLLLRCFALPADSPRFAWTSAAFGLSHAVLFFLHPSFGLATICCALPIWIKVVRSTIAWPRKLAVIAMLPVGLMLLAGAEKVAYAQKDTTGRIFGAMTLFAFNADVVVQEIDRDLSHPETAPYPQEILRKSSQLIHANFDRTTREGRTHPSLPYQPDVMIYFRDSVVSYLRNYFHDDPDQLTAFFHRYFVRGALRHPGTYVTKIGRSLAIAYGPTASLLAYVSVAINVPHELDYTQESLIAPYARLQEYSPGKTYAAQLALTPRQPQNVNARWVQFFVYGLSRFYISVIVICIFVLAASIHYSSGDSAPGSWLALRQQALVTMSLFSYNFFISLTISMVSALDNIRYSESQLAFSLFAFFAGVMLILNFLLARFPGIAGSPTATNSVLL